VADLDRLRTLTLDVIRPAFDALANGGSYGAWRRAMERAIRTAHTAAYIAATAERLGTTPKAIKGLSRAERQELDAQMRVQFKYLDGFLADMRAAKLTMAQASARAALYAGPSRGTFYAARYPGLPFYPTQGSECKANCRCWWEESGGQYLWKLAQAEHCPTCVSRASGNPYQVA